MARILFAALTLAITAAAVAVAAPDRSQVLSPEAPTVSWDGNVAVASLSPAPSQETCTKPVPAGRFCDETLIEVKAPGQLEVVIDEWTADSDLDLFLLSSDADGAFGDELGNSLNSGPGPEKVTARVQPGFYLVFVNYFQAVNSGYKGTATLKSSVPSEPEPAPTTTPPPASGDPSALPAQGQLAVDVKVGSKRARKPSAVVSCTVVCKAKLTLKAGKRTIAKGSATIQSKQPPPVALKLTAKGRKRVKKARRIRATLKATVTDSSGGQKTARSVKVTLRR